MHLPIDCRLVIEVIRSMINLDKMIPTVDGKNGRGGNAANK